MAAPLELNHLRYFQAVAEHGSLTAAAKHLRVTQPTLTVAMRGLETRLGTTLLFRGRSGVTLTRTGQELLAHVDDVFRVLDRAERRIRGHESEETGSFVVGCHESLGAYFLPELLVDFTARAPGIEVTLHNSSSGDVTDAVVGRRVDFGLVVNPIPHPELVLTELFRDAMDVVVAAGGGDRGGDDAPPTSRRSDARAARERVKAGPLVYAGRISQCQDLIGRLAAMGILPGRLVSCGDLELVKSLALGGLGVALLPRRVAAYGHPGRLRRLHPSMPFFPDTIYLAYRADMHRTKAALVLKDAIVAHGKKLATDGTMSD
jgi:DNA-binding transcriptional LysR family regulator